MPKMSKFDFYTLNSKIHVIKLKNLLEHISTSTIFGLTLHDSVFRTKIGYNLHHETNN